MTLTEMSAVGGLLVAVLGASFNYFKLEHSQRTELWSAGRNVAQIAWRCVKTLMHIFFIVWPVFSIWVFTTKSDSPTRIEITTLAMNFLSLVVWVVLSMVELRDWLRALKARRLAKEAPAAKRGKKLTEIKKDLTQRALDAMPEQSTSMKS